MLKINSNEVFPNQYDVADAGFGEKNVTKCLVSLFIKCDDLPSWEGWGYREVGRLVY